jgi:hypothetical protein
MAKKPVYDEASEVDSKAGSVDVTGPDAVDVTLTPIAAAKTGAKMVEKAAEAIGKEAMNKDARKRDLDAPYPD